MKHAIQDADGNITIIDLPDPPQAPLDSAGVLATLLAVAGVVAVEDAANAVNLPMEALVAEAKAWAAVINGVDNGD